MGLKVSFIKTLCMLIEGLISLISAMLHPIVILYYLSSMNNFSSSTLLKELSIIIINEVLFPKNAYLKWDDICLTSSFGRSFEVHSILELGKVSSCFSMGSLAWRFWPASRYLQHSFISLFSILSWLDWVRYNSSRDFGEVELKVWPPLGVRHLLSNLYLLHLDCLLFCIYQKPLVLLPLLE